MELMLIVLISFLAILFSGFLTAVVLRKNPGNIVMQNIADKIHKGAITFLKKETEVIIIFALLLSLIFSFTFGKELTVSFILGVVFTLLSSWVGMLVSTKANTRTTQAAKESQNKALSIAFASGSVTGLFVVGLGLLGIAALYMLYQDPDIIYGFALGTGFIALFARVGGGIFTKAADVGADLVGKYEQKIPEDDPRNPAVIADNVGDNVGDVAGMGSDLFESYVSSIVAAMAIGTLLSYKSTILPMLIASAGILSSITGVFMLRLTKKTNAMKILRNSMIISNVLMAILGYIVIRQYADKEIIGLTISLFAGLLCGTFIGLNTERYTGETKKYVKKIDEATKTGPAITILEGFAVGMRSTKNAILILALAIIASYYFAGTYGVAIASVAMLSTLGTSLAIDAYGPVADNAGGIAQMAKLPKSVRKKTDFLDAAGNTTAAIGKGFAIGSAALTSIALFAAYSLLSGSIISLTNPLVIVGVLLGAMTAFYFASLTIEAVEEAAFKMVKEVRRQFKEIKGLMQGKAEPEHEKCITISTRTALKQMIMPALLSVVAPILVGFVLGIDALGGMIAGVIVVGALLAITMSNAGGAWDNAKKRIEEGFYGGKKGPGYDASIIGDTVGDPMKDTAGPSLNILIKVVSTIAIIFVPLFLKYGALIRIG